MAFQGLRDVLAYANQPPAVAASVRIETPREDGDEEVSLVVPNWTPPREARRSAISGITLVIEYVDSRGSASRRRITLHEAEQAGDGRVLLHAYCHERRAARCFRLDRVKSLIDGDGVVSEDVIGFFQSVVGLQAPAMTTDATLRLEHLKSIEFEAVRLAVMLGQADGRLCEDELATIVSWVAARCSGLVTEEDLGMFGRYLSTLRLTGPMIDAAIDGLEAAPEDRKQAAIDLFYAVIEADGSEHPNEIALLDEIEAAIDDG